MANLLEQLLTLATAGTVMISSALTAAAPHNDINGLLYLQNRQWRSGSAYIPELREADVKGKVRELRDDAAAALEQMAADCKAETGFHLVSVSGYRSYQTQATIYQRKVKNVGSQKRADEYVARAGASEHQLGLAMDLGWEYKEKGKMRLYSGTSNKFPKSAAGAWATENCWKYGFILRYQEGWEDVTGYKAEEWHFRYVGRENAEKIYANQMPLENYLILLRQEVLMDIVLGAEKE